MPRARVLVDTSITGNIPRQAHQITESEDIEQVLQACENRLQGISDAYEGDQEARAEEIESVWHELESYQNDRPHQISRISSWRRSIEARFPILEILTNKLRAGRSRRQREEDQIQERWGAPVQEVLADIAPPHGWTNNLVEAVNKLSAHVKSGELARDLLSTTIQGRVDTPHGVRHAGMRRGRFLHASDCKKVIADVTAKTEPIKEDTRGEFEGHDAGYTEDRALGDAHPNSSDGKRAKDGLSQNSITHRKKRRIADLSYKPPVSHPSRPKAEPGPWLPPLASLAGAGYQLAPTDHVSRGQSDGEPEIGNSGFTFPTPERARGIHPGSEPHPPSRKSLFSDGEADTLKAYKDDSDDDMSHHDGSGQCAASSIGEMLDQPSVTPSPLPISPSISTDRHYGAPPSLPLLFEDPKPGFTMSTTDTEAALETIRDCNRMLSGSALDQCIDILSHVLSGSSFRMYSNTVFDSDHPALKPIEAGFSSILVPMHLPRKAHWILVKVDLPERQVHYYDSCQSEGEVSSFLRQRVDTLLQSCQLSSREWKHTLAKSAQQSNAVDCGIYTMITMLYLVCDEDTPATYDIALWRSLISSMVSGDSSNDPPLPNEDADGPTVGATRQLDSGDPNAMLQHFIQATDFVAQVLSKQSRLDLYQARHDAATSALRITGTLRARCDKQLASADPAKGQKELTGLEHCITQIATGITVVPQIALLGTLEKTRQEIIHHIAKTQARQTNLQEKKRGLVAAICVAERACESALKQREDRMRSNLQAASSLEDHVKLLQSRIDAIRRNNGRLSASVGSSTGKRRNIGRADDVEG
ncbi:MAG: hypothetical protein Q9225_006710 [Loekoesia sp. 1 TL-2023]